MADEVVATPLRTGGGSADFEDWVGVHGASLLRFAYLVVGTRAGAEDAVQEALARAFPRWDRISRVEDPVAYVRRMVVNAHISWWRRVRRHESPTPTFDDAPSSPAVGPEDVDRMWRLCQVLPVRQRAVIVLRYYEGLSTAQIASVLGVAEVTVRTQVHRALSKLRVALSEEQP